MRRILRILTNNGPLKLGAVALATVLYGGLVFSQNVRVWPGPVPIAPFGQRSDLFLLSISPQAVTSIRFVAPGDVAGRVSGESFRATVDLSGLAPAPNGGFLTAPVRVEALDPKIQVTGWTPSSVTVQLDQVVTRTVPIRVDRGTVPDGLSLGAPILDRSVAVARGPSSVIDRIDAAVARVLIDPSGLDVDEQVDLVAVDGRGDRLAPVDFDPPSVHVSIAVSAAGTTRAVPIVPVLRGTPAPGYAVSGLRVQPLTLTIAGSRALLQSIDQVETEAVSIDGARADVAANARLNLPAGITVSGGPDTVQVNVSIQPLTGSRTYSVAIELAGTSGSETYALSAGATLSTISGTLIALDALDGSSLRAVADVSGLGPGTYALVLSVAVPSGLRVASVDPQHVSVTIAAAPTPTPAPSP